MSFMLQISFFIYNWLYHIPNKKFLSENDLMTYLKEHTETKNVIFESLGRVKEDNKNINNIITM